MLKFSLKYGILAGSLSGTMMMIAFFSGIPTRGNNYLLLGHLLFMYLSSFLSIYMAKKFNGGEIEFSKALRVGVSAALLMGLIFASFTACYYYILNPNFADKYLVDIEISLKQAGIIGAELKKQMAEWKEDMSAYNQTLKILISSSLIAIILAAINSLIFCKKD